MPKRKEPWQSRLEWVSGAVNHDGRPRPNEVLIADDQFWASDGPRLHTAPAGGPVIQNPEAYPAAKVAVYRSVIPKGVGVDVPGATLRRLFMAAMDRRRVAGELANPNASKRVWRKVDTGPCVGVAVGVGGIIVYAAVDRQPSYVGVCPGETEQKVMSAVVWFNGQYLLWALGRRPGRIGFFLSVPVKHGLGRHAATVRITHNDGRRAVIMNLVGAY